MTVVFSSVLQCIVTVVFFKEQHRINAVDIKWKMTSQPGRINLSGQSMHRLAGPPQLFSVKTDDFFTSLFQFIHFSSITMFTFALWWGLQCGEASLVRANCTLDNWPCSLVYQCIQFIVVVTRKHSTSSIL